MKCFWTSRFSPNFTEAVSPTCFHAATVLSLCIGGVLSPFSPLKLSWFYVMHSGTWLYVDYTRRWGKRTAWAQEYQVNMGNTAWPCLLKIKQINCPSFDPMIKTHDWLQLYHLFIWHLTLPTLNRNGFYRQWFFSFPCSA